MTTDMDAQDEARREYEYQVHFSYDSILYGTLTLKAKDKEDAAEKTREFIKDNSDHLCIKWGEEKYKVRIYDIDNTEVEEIDR